MATRTRTANPNPTAAEQLSLLAPSDLPVQFRLDRRTRERGLAQIAAIRRQLAANAARRSPSSPDSSPSVSSAARAA